MKVGRARLSEDASRVRAMRKHLGDDFPLMADANMRWTVNQSIAAARSLDRFIENPAVIVEGNVLAPDRPGHGVAFDWATLEKMRVSG
jgi:L-alanine-DL-glutamate epimerase-like enolase superfamily enzyme